jgi:hypothetical protein
MKKLFLLVALVAITLVGCNPINPPDSPIVKVKKYTITVQRDSTNCTVTPTTIVVDSGKTATFHITTNFGFVVDSVKVNDTVVSAPFLPDIYLYNVSSNQKLEVSCKKDLSWYLVHTKWISDSTYVTINHVEWVWYDIPLNEVVQFLPDSTYNNIWPGIIGSGNKWSVDETTNPPTLNWQNDALSVKIELLNEKKFVYSFVDSQGDPSKKVYIPCP